MCLYCRETPWVKLLRYSSCNISGSHRNLCIWFNWNDLIADSTSLNLNLEGKRRDPPRPSRTPRAQSSTFLSARPAFMVLTLIAVALATSSAPSAKIVITVPASFIKNGSKIFFNEDFHGRLLLSAGLNVQHFQQFGKTENLESF